MVRAPERQGCHDVSFASGVRRAVQEQSVSGVTTRPQAAVDRALSALTTNGRFAVSFSGWAADAVAPLSAFSGTVGRSIHGLVIETHEGLGGKALALQKPVAAPNYHSSRAITHRYDSEVRAEQIQTLVAVPVVVGSSVRALLYGGLRTRSNIGDELLRFAFSAAKSVAWEISVEEEVQRRLQVAEADRAALERGSDPAHTGELTDHFAELRGLVRLMPDDATRERLEAFGEAVFGTEARGPIRSGNLSARELEVVTQVALGHRNADIAETLFLKESTVKAYLGSAMRKLGVTSRYQAVLAARAKRLIP